MQLLQGLSLALLFVAAPCFARSKPHYRVILPSGYEGWVQVIFNDPNAPPLPHVSKTGAYTIEVADNGVVRTSDFRVHDFSSTTQVLFRQHIAGKPDSITVVPSKYVIPGDSLGGFGVNSTAGRGEGYSWFFFIGPPSLRANIPQANWEKFLEQWHREHGNDRVIVGKDYPVPGEMNDNRRQ